MSILQIPLSEEMKRGLNERTNPIGISNTAYVKVLIAKDLGLIGNDNFEPGNLFNADRDNGGKGISIADMKSMLKASSDND